MPKSKSTRPYPPVYGSKRTPSSHATRREAMPKETAHRHHRWLVYLVILAVAVWLVLFSPFSSHTIKDVSPATTKGHVATKTSTPSTTKPQPVVSPCSGNTLANLIIVSISQRHIWACSYAVQSYNSPVVTGMEMYPSDLTPTGTYHIYAKQTNIYLKGSDSTGSWNDHVNYWMPFLYNKYGAYGFHDATWRAPDAFGNISPNTTNASHGCVETPLSTAKWLYNWAPIGTTVTIES